MYMAVLPPLPPGVATVTIGTLTTWIIFLIGLFTFVYVLKKRITPTFRELRNFLSDWSGESERPGVKRKPGVMERLSAVEYQFSPNGGNSFHDKLHKSLKQGEDNSEQLKEVREQLSLLLTYLGSKDETLRELVRKQHEIGLH